MVQQEVKKKTRVYGTVAILSALVLVSLIYVFGSGSGFAPNSPTTTPSSTPSGINPGVGPSVSPAVTDMKTFASYDALKNYLTTNSKGSTYFGGGPLDAQFFGGNSRAVDSQTAAPSMAAESGGTLGANSYSTPT